MSAFLGLNAIAIAFAQVVKLKRERELVKRAYNEEKKKADRSYIIMTCILAPAAQAP